MKTKLFLPLCILLNAFAAHATIHEVHVADFHFTPTHFDAIVGDTVKWILDNGTHTTTGTSVNIPQGAETWDAPIDASSQSFEYTITIAGDYFYFSKLDGDMSASFTATGVLPVKFIDLQVTTTKNNKALITWSTAVEQNTSYFSIQRSINAKDFIEIAKVNAARNSSVTKQYSYIDDNVNTDQTLFYKIITVDADGSRTASDVVVFQNATLAAKLVTSLGPNPVSNPCNLNLQFNIVQPEKILVQVYNSGGSLIRETYINAATGTNNNHLHLGELPRGVYKILFRSHQITAIETIAVQ
jgi:plastocyanin